GHLAQCESCGEQLRRIGRTSELVRAAVREQPSAELRERTLAYVRAVGRPRGEAAAVAGGGVAALDRPDPARPIGISASRAARGRRLPRGSGWAASLGGVAILAAAVAVAAVSIDRGAVEHRYDDTIGALAEVNIWTLRVDGEPDAKRVLLRPGDGSPPAATLLFSPSTTELVVVASDLPAPP